MKTSRKIAHLMGAAVIAATAWAVPAKRTPLTYQQSDGTSITVILSGDERHHGHLTDDGLVVKRNALGDWCYATASGVSQMIAHNAAQRSVDEQHFAASNAVTLEQAAPSRRPARIAAQEINEETQVPHMGSPRIPVILVNYSDYKIKGENPVERLKEHFVDNEKSAFAYFRDQSNGQFTPQFDFLGVAQLENERKTYGGNDRWGNDIALGQMVAESCTAMAGTDWSVYDNDHDGLVDVVILIYAGTGEAQSSIGEAVWPCQWDLASSDYGHDISMSGVTISKFAVFNEVAGIDDDNPELDGIGTFCHEFSHCLGMPDFYPTNSMGYYGMGTWSLMDYGCYNDNSNTPVGYTAYERNYLGWMDIEDAVPGTITLTPITAGGKAYKITNDEDPTGNEYFIIEARRQDGWEQFMAASGLMVTHVDYDEKAWADNTVNNNGQRQRMTIIAADNKQSHYNEAGDLFPYNGVDRLTDDSTPAARTYVGTGNVKRLHKPITDITRNDDGSITLRFMYTPVTGDVNDDGVVDVIDSNILTNILVGTDSADNYGGRADVTGDGVVDVSDVNAVTNIILTN